MDGLLGIVYGFIGLMFVAGAGALMLMFAFVQFTARLAIWLDVGKAYSERKQLATEVIQLRQSLEILSSGTAGPETPALDPNQPLVTAIKVNEPAKRGLGGGTGGSG